MFHTQQHHQLQRNFPHQYNYYQHNNIHLQKKNLNRNHKNEKCKTTNENRICYCSIQIQHLIRLIQKCRMLAKNKFAKIVEAIIL